MAESFSEWLRKRGAGAAVPSAPAPAPQPSSSKPILDLSGPPKSEPGPMSFLNTAIDILSRPLYAVGETAEALSNAVTPGADNGSRGFLEYAGDIASAPFRGLFSTNEDDKTHGADLIEHVTDRFGTAYNPDYVDREHNVNEIGKGIGGFVMDVGLDPLSYIPVAWGAKAVQAAGQGLRAATGGERAAAQLDDVTEALISKGRGTEDDLGQGPGGAETPSAPTGGGTDTPSVPSPPPASARPTSAPEPDGPVLQLEDIEVMAPAQITPGRTLREIEAPSATELRQVPDVAPRVIEASRTAEAPPSVRAADEIADGPGETETFLAGLRSSIDNAPRTAPAREVLDQIARDAEAGEIRIGGGQRTPQEVARLESEAAIEAVHKANAEEFPTVRLSPGAANVLRQGLARSVNGDAAALRQLEQVRVGGKPLGELLSKGGYLNLSDVSRLLAGDGAAKRIGQSISRYLTSDRALGGEVDFDELLPIFQGARNRVTAQVSGATKKVEDSLSALLARRGDPNTLNPVDEALGAGLVDLLSRKSPSHFESLRAQLREVLDEGADLAEWVRNADPQGLQALLRLSEHLHVPVAAEDLARARVALDEAAARAFDAAGAWSVTGKALVNALGRSFTHADDIYTVQVTRDVKRTGTNPTLDDARRMKESNAHVQYNVFKNLASEVFGKSPNPEAVEQFLDLANRYRGNRPVYSRNGQRLAGPYTEVRQVFGLPRARAFAEWQLARLKEADEVFDTLGFHSYISQRGAFAEQYGLSGKPISLSLNDIYGIVYRTVEGTPDGDVVLRALFHKDNVAPSVYMGTISRLMEMGDEVDISELANLLRTSTGPNGRPIMNSLAAKTLDPMERFRFGRDGKQIPNEALDGHGFRLKFAEILARDDVRGALAAKMAGNRETYLTRVSRETYQLSTDVLNRVNDFVLNSTSRESVLRAASQIRDDVSREATQSGATFAAAQAAADLSEGALGASVVRSAETALRAERAFNRGEDAGPLLDDVHEAILDDVVEGLDADGLADEIADVVDAEEVFDDALRQAEEDLLTEATRAGFRGENPFGGGGTGAGTPRRGGRSKRSRTILEMSIGSGAMLDRHLAKLLSAGGSFRTKFDQSFGMPNINPVRLSLETVSSKFTAANVHGINHLLRKFPVNDGTTSTWAAAFRALQTGDRGGLSDDALRLLAGDAGRQNGLEHIVSRIVPTSADDGFLSSIFYQNSDISHITALLEKNGLPAVAKTRAGGPLFDIERAQQAVKAGTYRNLSTAIAQQWRDWEIVDIPGFVSRMSWAVAEAAEARAMNTEFKKLAKASGMMWDPKTAPKGAKPPQGFVKMKPTGKSYYGAFIDRDVFFHKDLARELVFADHFMRQPKRMAQKVMTDYYQPLLSAWKFSVTVLRPGHHLRNMVGDWSATWLAFADGLGRVPGFVKHGKDSLGLLLAHRTYEGVDAANALRGLKTSATDVGSRIRIKTRQGTLNGDQVYDAAMKEGIFPTVAMSEDLFFDETGQVAKNALQRFEELVRENRVGRVAGGLSEYRDHYARLHHFMIFLDRNGSRYASHDELFAAAAENVRKYHPDASMLTRFESKYARMVLPFYSWFRGILPAVFESAVRNPASVTIIPKLSYNAAVAMGVNPESLYQPFPEDQLFPSFLTGQMIGPQAQLPSGEYLGVNPGLANIDIFQELGHDPVRNILGMVSPLIRVPAEIASGGQWSTGSRITDMSDYVDSQIPVVNYLANISGYSPTSPIVEGQLDTQRGFKENEQGETSKSVLDQLISAGNWVHGMGVSNMSRPSFINYAEIERRNAESGG